MDAISLSIENSLMFRTSGKSDSFLSIMPLPTNSRQNHGLELNGTAKSTFFESMSGPLESTNLNDLAVTRQSYKARIYPYSVVQINIGLEV